MSGLDADLTVTRDGFTLQAALTARPGEVLAVLGPNGSGKTTLLGALAGLVPLAGGRVSVGDAVWADRDRGVELAPQRRSLGVVFQDYRLFGHLSVLDNVAFGLRLRGLGRRQARARAQEWVQRVGLAELADRRPGELSGGQAQRTALARALAPEPSLLLLDEPLAALDARTRLEIRSELRRHLAGYGGPGVLVTHDPLDALVLADRILVLEGGRVTQQGAPAEVARHPRTEYVARLMGLNLFPGTLADPATVRVELDAGGVLHAAAVAAVDPAAAAEPVPAGARVLVALAPTAIALHPANPGHGSPRNVWSGTVSDLELLTDRIRVAVEGRPPVLVDITPAALANLGVRPGQRVWLTAKATEVVVYPD